MATRPPRITDEEIERIMGNLLRTAVLVSAAVVLVGGIVYLLHHAAEAPDYHVFRSEPASYRTFSGIVRSVEEARGRGIIQAGILLLIATPVARVAFGAAAFALQRDRLYVAVSLIVLTVLLYSILGGYFLQAAFAAAP
jgi:uncharacterized membrane protein